MTSSDSGWRRWTGDDTTGEVARGAATLLGLDSTTVGIGGVALGAILLLVGGWRFLANLRLLEAFPEGCSRIHWFFGDERWVAKEDKESNEGMARSVLLDPLNIQEDRIHSWQAGTGSPISCARQYEQILGEALGVCHQHVDVAVQAFSVASAVQDDDEVYDGVFA